MMESFGTTPLVDVPMVRVVDEDDKPWEWGA